MFKVSLNCGLFGGPSLPPLATCWYPNKRYTHAQNNVVFQNGYALKLKYVFFSKLDFNLYQQKEMPFLCVTYYINVFSWVVNI